MSKISIDDIEKVAKLSRIELSSKSKEKVAEEFGAILDFVEIIQKADTEVIEPTSQVTGLIDVWREDKITKSEIDPSDLISAAPDKMDGYVKVKKVL